jgi:predicted DNA-binding WGR domain protein
MTDTLVLERRNPARNLYRFYRLSVERNLFGEWSLVRQWGRIGQTGCARRDLYATWEEAHHAFCHLQRAKRQRGYG